MNFEMKIYNIENFGFLILQHRVKSAIKLLIHPNHIDSKNQIRQGRKSVKANEELVVITLDGHESVSGRGYRVNSCLNVNQAARPHW
jgi:hypothetical protein